MRQQPEDSQKPESHYRHPDPLTDEALDWFMRLHGEPVEKAARDEYEEWVRQDPRRADAMDRLNRMQASPSLRRATAKDAKRLGLATKRPERTGKKRKGKAIGTAAAAILLIIGLHQYPAVMLRWQADYQTDAGQVRTVHLPDGSAMTLNTASAVTLDFADGRRNVKILEGEAFFDVLHDSQHPFRVAGQFGEAEVKGTAFSVRSDDEQDAIVLERGRVDVSRLADRDDKAALQPGEMVTATVTALSAVRPADLDQALSWLDGRLVFHDRPFVSALAELRRYYSGTIIVSSTGRDRVSVSGNYRIDDIETAIRTLTEAAGGSVTRLPGGILIIR